MNKEDRSKILTAWYLALREVLESKRCKVHLLFSEVEAFGKDLLPPNELKKGINIFNEENLQSFLMDEDWEP